MAILEHVSFSWVITHSILNFDEALIINEGGVWSASALTTDQNGDNDDEIARVVAQYPGELEAVKDRRVLGAMAAFRGGYLHRYY